MKTSWSRVPKFSRFVVALVLCLFAFTGTVLLFFGRAAPFTSHIEAEAGTRSSNVSTLSNVGASGQNAIKFSSSASGGTVATIIAVSDMQYGPSGTDRSGTANRVVQMAASADYVIVAGDIAYDGVASQYQEFNNEYGAIKSKIRPSPGNHDNYSDNDALGYDTYFGATPHGTKPNYWYSFNVGAWHIVSLNAGVDTATASYSTGSAQLQWLESDLTANSTRPTLLYFHAPRYTGSNYSDETSLQNSVKPIWNVALTHKVELIINGHDHSYQRFAPMDAEGNATASGIREIIAATGCYSQRNVDSGAAPNLEKWSTSTSASWCGALRLKLYSDRYEWEFVNNAGSVLDTGFTPVHAR